MANKVERKLAAILSADMVGYGRRLEHVRFACAHPARSISLQLKQMRRRR